MGKLVCDGVTLFFADAGRGTPPLVLIHGLGGDHTFFTAWFDHFRGGHRVVAVDLRGHGESSVPPQGYTISNLADDLAWMCYELGLYQPVLVGHGVGAIIAVECAVRSPQLPVGVVALDSPLIPTTTVETCCRRMLERLHGPAGPDALRQAVKACFGPKDDPQHKGRILDQVALLPHWVMLRVWESACAWDGSQALAKLAIPLLYIASGSPLSDLVRLRDVCPQAIVGLTDGAGLFHQLEVRKQIEAMIEQFVNDPH